MFAGATPAMAALSSAAALALRLAVPTPGPGAGSCSAAQWESGLAVLAVHNRHAQSCRPPRRLPAVGVRV